MTVQDRPVRLVVRPESPGLLGWLTSRDHKRIGLLIITTSLLIFFGMGALAMVMRTQLARPENFFVGPQLYDELFTIHGSGMIYLVVTPLAIGLGVYLVPLQIGAPRIAAPNTTRFGYWLYLAGAVGMLSGFLTKDGAADTGWTAYPPLSDSQYSPGTGVPLWILGTVLAAVGMLLLSGTVLWTIVRLRAPHMSMLRIPVFTWSMLATTLMGVMAFPSLLAALGLLALGRVAPGIFGHNLWNIGYQHLFWFYGHPVVYVMFFPFVGCVAEVFSTFSGRRFFGYTGTALSLLAFAALSMSVWGHHMFTTGQVSDDYYSLTSIALSVPAGLEYFALIGTLLGGRLVYRTPLLFGIAFLPQFLIGGLTGIMVATPSIDTHAQDSYFVIAHFHYTLFAGSMFGAFAGLYYWFPKMTGYRYDERLGRIHFWFMVVGANVTFLPMFALGYLGMPRRVFTYRADAGLTTLNLVSSIGAFVLGLGMLVLAYNLAVSLVRKRPAGDDPWHGSTLEWAAASPPSRFNFDAAHPLPLVSSFAPLFDERDRERSPEPAGA